MLTDDVVTELPETRQLRRAVGAHVQDVPDILIGALKTAEPEEKWTFSLLLTNQRSALPDGHPEQPLAAPQSAGRDEQLPHGAALAAVHRHGHLLLNVGLKYALLHFKHR